MFETDIEIKAIEENDLQRCIEVLRSGGIIVYPTDTIWGIGCDATNAAAVARIYFLKQRSDSKSMLMLVSSVEMLHEWVTDIPEAFEKQLLLMERPTTVIYDTPRGIAENLLAEDGSAGFRVTREAFSKALCERLGRPLVSTSANISGRPSARVFSEIEEEIKRGVDYVADYRRDDMTQKSASSIIKLLPDGEIITIR